MKPIKLYALSPLIALSFFASLYNYDSQLQRMPSESLAYEDRIKMTEEGHLSSAPKSWNLDLSALPKSELEKLKDDYYVYVDQNFDQGFALVFKEVRRANLRYEGQFPWGRL
ncbi:MAG: hypothetical protein Q4P72_03635, partial [Eubacteriales bacterium]|nr:hypothetical protein [Eubacteriales bacterium]